MHYPGVPLYPGVQRDLQRHTVNVVAICVATGSDIKRLFSQSSVAKMPPKQKYYAKLEHFTSIFALF